jgi:hypothetical protein
VPEVVAFSPDGRRLAAGSSFSVVVYELADRVGRQLPGHGFYTTALAVHPRKPLLAFASRVYDVSLADVDAGRELHRWERLGGMVGNLVFSPDGRLLATAPYARLNTTQWLSGDVNLLETETGKVRKRFAGRFSAAVAFDPAGRRLALGDQRGAVTLCDVESGETAQHWQATRGWISEVAFCAGGAQLLVGEVGGVLRVCDVADGRTLRQVTLPRGLIRFALDGARRRVAAVDLAGTVRVLALPGLEVVAALERPEAPGWVGLGFSSDGRWLAVGGADRRVTLYDAGTFRKVLRLPPQTGTVTEVAWQRAGPGLAVSGSEELLTFWDLSRVEPALAGNGFGWDEAAPDGPGDAPQTRPRPALPWERRPGGTVPRDWQVWVLQQVVDTAPDQPDVCMELAWVLVSGPKEFRDPSRALPLARRAVELAPDEPLCLNTLGVVYYRLGKWQEAAATLEASAAKNPQSGTAYDLFFLAMTYGQTGKAEKARACYHEALGRWRSQGNLAPYQVTELRAIRAEAEELLGIDKKE